MIAVNEAERLESTAEEYSPPATAGRFFRREGRRLIISFGIAVIVELGLLLWFAHASLQTIKTEVRLSSSNANPKPIEISIVQPGPVAPTLTHLRMPGIQKLPVLPKLAAQTGTIVLPPIHSAVTLPPIDWRQAMQDYFHRQIKKITPFKMPVLPKRPPSVYGLPTRMSLPGGGEIDRIGNNCYAVPANHPIAAMGTNRSVLPHAMFAHQVPCLPDSQRSFGQDFLDALHRRDQAKSPSGK